ncbi:MULTISPECIES: MarR family winged helix-turn-helix transcriptional regulator [unclassified Actinotalea]|uniref:MarR family winged helix-turn-helix transcriptional regulator n=1 Tax=unclassified Actinotalea TaxID=2638618 RepID=UPI0021083ECD|nr:MULTISPECIES: MarR family winged helix-turn-helix transcriptional regulator [unclassified Actinotalea]
MTSRTVDGAPEDLRSAATQQAWGDGAPAPGQPIPTHRWPTGRLISAVARRIERDWNAHLAAWDLNHASLPVLFLLAAGPRSQRELAAGSGVTEQTMSRIIARLDRTGYIERRTHANDRRRNDVALTEEGFRALQEAGDPRFAEELSVRGLSAEQVGQLREILAVMMAGHPRAWDVPPGEVPDEAPDGTSDDACRTPPAPSDAG